MQRTSELTLPTEVQALAETLGALPGAVAVALGGSQAIGGTDPRSDWDLAVYYRGEIGLDALAAYGEVYPPGAWGRIMNGGAWLRLREIEVDVILRDLDVAEHWTEQAMRGVFELDTLLGYLAGIPTYSLAAELALGRVLIGTLPVVGPVPARLVESAPQRWRFARDFSLEYARMHARRGNIAGAVGQTAKAAMEAAHARLCAEGRWTLNEKRLLAEARLGMINEAFASHSMSANNLVAWVDALSILMTE